MEIELVKATRADTPTLRHLYELYCHDFSEYTHSDVREDGLYTDDGFLTGYWREPKWSSFLFMVNGRLAGFAWVLKTSIFAPGGDSAASAILQQYGLLAGEHILMEEFFILRKYRRQGLGRQAAVWLFDQFPGVWEVSEMVENTPAQAFWRKVIGAYTSGRFVEINNSAGDWRGPVQVFRSESGSGGINGSSV